MLTYEQKYTIAAKLINKGYLIHCTNSNFDKFDSKFINGGARAKEGYGFYFSDMPYKSIEYGDKWKIVKKNVFNFIDSSSKLNTNMFHDSYRDKIFSLEEKLNYVRSNREYDAIQEEIYRLESEYEEIGGSDLFRMINYTIRRYNPSTIGNLEYKIENPQKYIPLLTKLYVSYGYDGYETDGIYTIFNFDKLNEYVEDFNPKEYNLNESLDVSSFEIKNELNPDFWKNDKLDSRIRLKLLDIADDFTDYLNVNWVKPEDIIMTGSLANYNWSVEHSDIDLHVIFDFKKVDKRVDFVRNYFNSKKQIWNQEHGNINILGYPVELYVQDKNEKHSSSGIYSIEENKWLIKPEKVSIDKTNLNDANKKAEKWAEKIDSLIDKYSKDSIESNKERILKQLENTFDNIKNIRKNGFLNGGDEYNKDNLTFKILRRNGYLDKIDGKKTEIYDDLMSINEDSFGSRIVKNNKLYSLLKKEGLEGIILCKGYGYFYIDAITPKMQKVIDTLKDTTIYLNAFNQQPVEMWVQDIKDLLKDSIVDEIESSQKPKEYRIKLTKISENTSNDNNIEVWYRGYNSTYGSERTHLIWMTDDISYASEYGDSIEEIRINTNKLNVASFEEIDNIVGYYFDYIYGPTKNDCKYLLDNNINSYCFYANNDDSYCMCLWDTRPIISRRTLDKNEISNLLNENASYNTNCKLYHQTKNDFNIIKSIIENGLIPQDRNDEGNGIWFSQEPFYDVRTTTFSIPNNEKTLRKYNFNTTFDGDIKIARNRIPFEELTVENIPFAIINDNSYLFSSSKNFLISMAKKKGYNSIAEYLSNNKNFKSIIIYKDLFDNFVEKHTSYIFDKYPNVKIINLFN